MYFSYSSQEVPVVCHQSSETVSTSMEKLSLTQITYNTQLIYSIDETFFINKI
jgi:hypothetical protein